MQIYFLFFYSPKIGSVSLVASAAVLALVAVFAEIRGARVGFWILLVQFQATSADRIPLVVEGTEPLFGRAGLF